MSSNGEFVDKNNGNNLMQPNSVFNYGQVPNTMYGPPMLSQNFLSQSMGGIGDNAVMLMGQNPHYLQNSQFGLNPLYGQLLPNRGAMPYMTTENHMGLGAAVFTNMNIPHQQSMPIGVVSESFHANNHIIPHITGINYESNNNNDNFEDNEEDLGGDQDAQPSTGTPGAANEHTGRWTRKEHLAFLDALKKYGKEWKKVASMVGSRTVVQTRTHAQKYFQKLSKSSGLPLTPLDNSIASSGLLPMTLSAGTPTGPSCDEEGADFSRLSSLHQAAMSSERLMTQHHSQAHSSHKKSKAGANNSGSNTMAALTPAHLQQQHQQQHQHQQGHQLTAMSNTWPPNLNIQTPSGPNTELITPSGMACFVYPGTGGGGGGGSAARPPLPSPAACGKRKKEELAAAEMMLVASSSSKDKSRAPGSSSSGVQSQAEHSTSGPPSALKTSNSNNSFISARKQQQFSALPNLFIINPDDFPDRVQVSPMVPETPWESEIRALQSWTSGPLSASSSQNKLTGKPERSMSITIATPGDQRTFLARVRLSIRSGDVAGLSELLHSAESAVADTAAAGGGAVFTAFSPLTILESDGSGGGGDNNGHHVTCSDVAEAKQQEVINNGVNNADDEEEAVFTRLTSCELLSPTVAAAETSAQADSEHDIRINSDSQSVTVSRMLNVLGSQGRGDVSAIVEACALACGVACRNTGLAAIATGLTNSSSMSQGSVAATVDILSEEVVLGLCKLLIVYGADVTGLESRTGNTGLHFAALSGYDHLGRLLVNRGCPMNVTNAHGDTALHLAARHGHANFLNMLIDNGANCHLRNLSALSALDEAGAAVSQTWGGDDNKDNKLVKNEFNNNNNVDHQSARSSLRRLMLSTEPRLRTLILFHEDCLEHTARRSTDWEGPDRLLRIMARLKDPDEFASCELEISSQFDKASVELLTRVHSSEYIAFVDNLSKQLQANSIGDGTSCHPCAAVPFTPQVQKVLFHQTDEETKNPDYCDTAFSTGTLKAARRAAGAVAHAVDMVLMGRNRNAFCVVRPPGHHVGHMGLLNGGKSCGFCIFNSVAAAALHALENHHCQRVAIIDLDVHHGNGTEDIVRRYEHPSRLFFFSLHLYDKSDSCGGTSASVSASANSEANNDTTQAAAAAAPPYEFFPGTGGTDDMAHNIINVPMRPLWYAPAEQHHSQSHTRTSRSHGSTTVAAATATANAATPATASTLSTTAAATPPAGQQQTSTPLPGNVWGREAYKQIVQQRLTPALRAFNPDLILLSMGFDPAEGDLGNQRQGMRAGGMNMRPEDFQWVTSEILRVADMCCNGKVVSVLEGGYGEYHRVVKNTRSAKKTAVHNSNKDKNEPVNGRDDASSSHSVTPVDDQTASSLNRTVLAAAACAHVHSLVDPYGPHITTK